MARWREVEEEAPELAASAKAFFDAFQHKTLATVRRDGSPRISGIEVIFRDGELWLGSMPNAVKAMDLRRDPRFAMHSGSQDPPGWKGDAKLAGRVVEIEDEETRVEIIGDKGPRESHLYRADIDELVVVTLGGDPPDRLVIESWHEGRGVTRRERA